MLELFPGRTLEELDALDWPRLQKALKVRRMLAVEAKRSLQLRGRIDKKAISAEEWQMIRDHDMLLESSE